MIASTIALFVAGLLLAEPAVAQEVGYTAQNVKQEQQQPAETADTVATADQETRTPTPQIDVRIYGATKLSAQGNDLATALPYTPPKPVPASEAVRGSLLLAEGDAARAAANREKTSELSSAAAGVSLIASELTPSAAPDFAQDSQFNSAEFLDKVVDFTLDVADEKFILEAQSEEEARYRMEILRERYRTTTVWKQNSHQINLMIAAAAGIALLFWWWLSRSSQAKTRVTRWTVRGVVLLGSFYLHWAFGLFMLLGLYTHITRSHSRV